jgi:hypothetical protein
LSEIHNVKVDATDGSISKVQRFESIHRFQSAAKTHRRFGRVLGALRLKGVRVVGASRSVCGRTLGFQSATADIARALKSSPKTDRESADNADALHRLLCDTREDYLDVIGSQRRWKNVGGAESTNLVEIAATLKAVPSAGDAERQR